MLGGVKGGEASVSLLQGSIMCPYYGGVRDRGSDHGSVDPLRNVRAWAPVAMCGGQQGVEEAFSLGGLGEDVIMPPHPAIECESQVLSTKAVRDGMTRDSESPGQTVRVRVKKTTWVFMGLKVSPQSAPQRTKRSTVC